MYLKLTSGWFLSPINKAKEGSRRQCEICWWLVLVPTAQGWRSAFSGQISPSLFLSAESSLCFANCPFESVDFVIAIAAAAIDLFRRKTLIICYVIL
ncbi:hypothetical protein QQP08_008351 [Theobroma cacao]|nr:hypothetical protein QQP08_008351 [Theobroma cacao]